ncbi:MAG: hypothetical protein AAF399_29630 [Bacteroidota bacterium]
MMRLLVLFFACTLSLPLFSQTITADSQMSVSTSHRRVAKPGAAPTLSSLKISKEQELKQYLSRYETESGDMKSETVPQIRAVLYQLLDLSLKEQQEEANLLLQRLHQLEQDPTLSDQKEYILQLKQTLDSVENKIQFRQENRDRIVERRLTELL